MYFRADVVRITAAAARAVRKRRIEHDDERMAVLLVVASLPAATVGAVLDSMLEGKYGPIWVIGVMLIAFGLVLAWADRLPQRRDVGAFRVRDAVLMGTAQALALQPGVSRSGATISMGRWLGFDRDSAARISFLMSLPIIAGAGIYKALDVFVTGDGVPRRAVAVFGWGFAAAAVTGFVAVWALLRLVRTRSFLPFVYYRVALGVVVIAVSAMR